MQNYFHQATRPIIGVTLDFETGGADKYSKFDFYALRENYCGVIDKFGGLPMALPHHAERASDYLDALDGLVVTGGAFDVDPSLFGASERHATVVTKANRTQFELAMVRGAVARDMPILGICGGEQVLAVALGGSLIQHIPDAIPQSLAHEQPNPRTQAGHTVLVVRGSKLAALAAQAGFGEDGEIPVNSAHHQAVAAVPPPLYVSARAPDGVTEAIEHQELRFCLGIQWHPEFLISPLDATIFQAFIHNAQAYGQTHARH